MREGPHRGDDALGVYIHVPFCRTRCVYCDFYVETGREGAIERFTEAVVREWDLLARDEFGDVPPVIDTVYFGGGTPSLLPAASVARILGEIRARGRPTEDLEVTLEANPESVTEEMAEAWKSAGVNRMSLGVQSFEPDVLKTLRRLHTADRAAWAYTTLREAGFARISLDFIYGIGPRSSDGYRRSLTRALALDPGHISSYLLTVEDGTPLGRLSRMGRWPAPTDEEAASDYEWTRSLLEGAGYEAYEVSNFARPGQRSRHNERYWLRRPYVGLGPGAHSHLGLRRWANASDLTAYMKVVLEDRSRPVVGLEAIDRAREAQEWIFLGLRRSEGIGWERLAPLLTPEALQSVRRAASRLSQAGYVVAGDDGLRLSERGILLSTSVMVELLSALETDLLSGAPAP